MTSRPVCPVEVGETPDERPDNQELDSSNYKGPFAAPPPINDSRRAVQPSAVKDAYSKLDKSGKPCRRWVRKPLQLTDIVGTTYTVSAWQTPLQAHESLAPATQDQPVESPSSLVSVEAVIEPVSPHEKENSEGASTPAPATTSESPATINTTAVLEETAEETRIRLAQSTGQRWKPEIRAYLAELMEDERFIVKDTERGLSDKTMKNHQGVTDLINERFSGKEIDGIVQKKRSVHGVTQQIHKLKKEKEVAAAAAAAQAGEEVPRPKIMLKLGKGKRTAESMADVVADDGDH